MDPQQAFDAFAAAGPFVVQTAGGKMQLCELNDTGTAYIRQSNKRSDVIGMAKKYIKAKEAVDELVKALDAFPGATPDLPPVETCAAQGRPLTKDNPSNAVVPYVNIAPPTYARQARMQEIGLDFKWVWVSLDDVRKSWLFRMYKKAAVMWIQLICLAPLLLLFAYAFHFLGISALPIA